MHTRHTRTRAGCALGIRRGCQFSDNLTRLPVQSLPSSSANIYFVIWSERGLQQRKYDNRSERQMKIARVETVMGRLGGLGSDF